MVDHVMNRYPVAVTDHVQKTMNGSVDFDPVARQYLPQQQELVILPQENVDPIGDFSHTPVKGIVHRHQNRVLFKLANVCAVYCRFCFRRDMVGPGGDVLSRQERTEALSYIRSDSRIEEVIFTGGDPFVVSPRQIGALLDELDTIDHVGIIRFHTRIPVADPDRITPRFLEVLQRIGRPVYVVIHINHTQEITPRVVEAFNALRRGGCILLSQSVLLRGVNDDVDILTDLFQSLGKLGVKPYYIHHPDLAPGTSHFRVPIKTGQSLMRDVARRVSGICLPEYVLDIPGGYGKVPLNDTYVECVDDHTYLIEDENGVVHRYTDLIES